MNEGERKLSNITVTDMMVKCEDIKHKDNNSK